MAVAPISEAPLAFPQALSSSAAAAAAPREEPSFYEIVERFVGSVNQQQLNADTAVQQMIAGEAENIHDVMLALAKADLTFRMFLEVRNRAIDAYQEIMRLQL
ncbi:MAG: flagellar hook-basal body complex protein FliE [Planctomycetes bacterium]|nr:flagellar hook-basal body complex protein FliE [Planctomycetota bacterium]